MIDFLAIHNAVIEQGGYSADLVDKSDINSKIPKTISDLRDAMNAADGQDAIRLRGYTTESTKEVVVLDIVSDWLLSGVWAGLEAVANNPDHDSYVEANAVVRSAELRAGGTIDMTDKKVIDMLAALVTAGLLAQQNIDDITAMSLVVNTPWPKAKSRHIEIARKRYNGNT